MNQTGPGHLDALTGIRGIAAWGVVLYHIRLSLTVILPAPVIAVLAKGYLAVDLFFILSGFVIWYNYAARIRSGGWGETRHFLWRRFARVWPLHAAILGAFLGFAGLLILSGRDHSGYPLAELPLHIALLQNWGFTPGISWNHPAWSISTEFAAYLVFPALVLAMPWDKVRTWTLVAMAAMLMLGVHLLFALNGYDTLGEDIAGLGLWRCLAGFAMGCLMCQLWQRWRDRARAGLFAGLACIALIAGAALLELPETAWIPGAFFAGLLALALGRGPVVRVIGGRMLTYLGEISYSTYLAHFLLFILFKLAFVDQSLQLGWAGLAGFLVLLMASSAALYHWLEKPAQRWLNARPPGWVNRLDPHPAE